MASEPDLSEEVRFHDPHPGFLGAAAPIPEPVRLAAQRLDGKTMTLRDALALLRESTDGELRAVPDFRYVSLRIAGRGGEVHVYRVIRYAKKAGA